MKFDDALLLAVEQCRECGIDDPFFLYCVLSDRIGADFAGKDAVRMLYEIDRRIHFVKNIQEGGKLACVISQEAYPAFQEQYSQRTFYDFIDDVYCILTHAPRKERQSVRTRVKIAKKHGGRQRGKVGGKTPAPAPARPNIYARIPSNIPPHYYGLWLLQQAIKKK